jgi:hypothetical protein
LLPHEGHATSADFGDDINVRSLSFVQNFASSLCSQAV